MALPHFNSWEAMVHSTAESLQLGGLGTGPSMEQQQPLLGAVVYM